MVSGPCRTCRFCRAPAPVKLFSEEDLKNPEVEKVAHEVHEWQRQRQLDEGQRIANRILFEHQPKNFEWCAGYTGQINKFFTRRDARFFHDELLRRKAQGARDFFEQVVGTGQDLTDAADAGDRQAAERLEAIRRDRTDPISGELISYFVPALYVNDDGGCDHWEEGTDQTREGG